MEILEDKTRLTFSGHDSFPCRNFWLKKGYDYVRSGKNFSDEDSVIELGVGKNMVSAIKFWMKSFGILDSSGELTPLADFIFRDSDGVDQYLEDDVTLWLLHFHLVKEGNASIYSLIFNRLRKERIEFSKEIFIQHVLRNYGAYNENSLGTDFNVFTRMYLKNATRSKDREDNLSELLSELNLLDSYRSEKREFYTIENQDREEIPDELILYSILNSEGLDMSVNLKSLETDFNSVGNIFALNRHGLFTKIQSLVEKFDFLVFNDQAGIKELQFKSKPSNPFEILRSYYERK